MGEVIDMSTARQDKLARVPDIKDVYTLPVMPLALGEDQPITEDMFTLPDGRLVRLFSSEAYGQQYLVGVPRVERTELLGERI